MGELTKAVIMVFEASHSSLADGLDQESSYIAERCWKCVFFFLDPTTVQFSKKQKVVYRINPSYKI